MSAPPQSSPSLVDTLFQRSLEDMIKSLRSIRSADAEQASIARFTTEIRREIRSADKDTKAVAISKLTYLASIYSIPMAWAAFHILELIPSQAQSRIAYLAASLSFHPSTTDLIPLATHQIHKHMTTTALAGPALHLLALAASPDLAQHLAADLVPIITSSSASYTFIRPKAVVAALRILAVYPEAVPLLFKPMVDCISSADKRTASAAIGAFCELAVSAADPAPYMPLAPEFFRVLVDGSSNNWVIIKVLKIFARLSPLEPRLAARIVDPVCNLMRESRAKSVVFECVRTVLSSLAAYDQAVKVAVEKVKDFLAADEDSNLRYLGLQALSMLGPEHSWVMEENREMVIRSLTDPDHNIRSEALRLLMGMVNEGNVVEVAELLIKYALKSDPEFANQILDALLETCGRNVYELIVDFDWYASLLGEMARNPHCAKGEEIGRQLVDIALRVKDARSELVRVARELLIDPALLGNTFLCEILSAAAWISGEYVEFSRNLLELVEALLQPRTNLLPSLVRAVYILSVFKVITFAFITYYEQIEAGKSMLTGSLGSGRLEQGFSDASASNPLANDATNNNQIISAVDEFAAPSAESVDKTEFFNRENILYMLNLIEMAVGVMIESDEVEVQERARNVLGLIHMLQQTRIWNIEEEYSLIINEDITQIVDWLREAFSDELGLVSISAQKRVSVPDGLVLCENLADLATVLDDADVPCTSISFSLRQQHLKEIKNDSANDEKYLSEHRKRHGLYYLGSEKEAEWDDYPRANEPLLPASLEDALENSLKISEESTVPRRTKPTKPRPVVVKLDDGEDASSFGLTRIKENKDDLLSGAVRDVLIPNECKLSFTQNQLPENVSRRSGKDKFDNSESISKSKEISSTGNAEQVSSSSSRSKHRSHHKEENLGKTEEGDKSHRTTRSSNRHGKHKHRQRGDGSINVVPQAPVIQDFLL